MKAAIAQLDSRLISNCGGINKIPPIPAQRNGIVVLPTFDSRFCSLPGPESAFQTSPKLSVGVRRGCWRCQAQGSIPWLPTGLSPCCSPQGTPRSQGRPAALPSPAALRAPGAQTNTGTAARLGCPAPPTPPTPGMEAVSPLPQ